MLYLKKTNTLGVDAAQKHLFTEDGVENMSKPPFFALLLLRRTDQLQNCSQVMSSWSQITLPIGVQHLDTLKRIVAPGE